MKRSHHPLLVYVYALEVGDTRLARALARSVLRDRASPPPAAGPTAAARRRLAERTVAAIASALGLRG
jgi:hypothetical protein